MDIIYPAGLPLAGFFFWSTSMKSKIKKRRPGLLLRMYPNDLAELSRLCAEQCTPRENYCRRAILAKMEEDKKTKAGAV